MRAGPDRDRVPSRDQGCTRAADEEREMSHRPLCPATIRLSDLATWLRLGPSEPARKPVARRRLACDCYDVLRSLVIRTLLALCVLAGLVAGPSAFAAAPHAAMAPMSQDMDCCPPKPDPFKCPKCPLMALCSAALPVDAERVVTTAPIMALLTPIRPADERIRDGRALVPPARPPRSLV